jgi:hypothetical protein
MSDKEEKGKPFTFWLASNPILICLSFWVGHAII